MTAPANLSTTQPVSEPAEPVDPAKPAEDPLAPSELLPATAVRALETADEVRVSAPEAPARAAVPPPELAQPILAGVPVAASLPAPVTMADASGERDLFATIAESRAALARSVESITDELASLVRSGIDVATDTAIGMLTVKTWSDAVAVNAKFAGASYNRWLDSTTKLSELGVRLAYESSKPLISRFERVWRSAVRVG